MRLKVKTKAYLFIDEMSEGLEGYKIYITRI